MSNPNTGFFIPEDGFTYENVFGGKGPQYTPYDGAFDPGGTYSFPEGTNIGIADGSQFDLSGTNFTPGKGNNSFLDVLAANVGGLGADIATLFGGSSSGKGKKGADAIADYVKESTGILNEIADETEAKIGKYAREVNPGLTDKYPAEALREYYKAFSDTITRTENRSLSQLANRPEIDQEYDRLSGRVGNILNNNQYNLASQAGGYGNIVRGEGVVQMDQGRLDAAGDRLLNAKYKQAYDYGDPQTSKFIYGSADTAKAIGKYYNTSGDVAGLMSYGAVG